MIKITNLKKYYNSVKAVDDISLEIKPREVLGFLGPNGAGKTTTMKIITGFIAPTSGRIEVGDLRMPEDSLKIREKIGYLPENNPLYQDMKVYEYLRFIAEIHGMDKTKTEDRLQKMIEVCKLNQVIRKPISELSKGYRQRVGLAQAMIHDPEILILDEPTSGLDPNQILEIRELIRELGKEKTVILSTHILQEVQAVCDRIVIINNGKIVGEGTPEELSQKVGGLNSLYVKIKGAGMEFLGEVKKLANILEAKLVDKESDEIMGYRLHIQGEHDLREELFKLVSEKGWSILESAKEKFGLEDVFKKLTK